LQREGRITKLEDPIGNYFGGLRAGRGKPQEFGRRSRGEIVLPTNQSQGQVLRMEFIRQFAQCEVNAPDLAVMKICNGRHSAGSATDTRMIE
jgi:hypothetical protein